MNIRWRTVMHAFVAYAQLFAFRLFAGLLWRASGALRWVLRGGRGQADVPKGSVVLRRIAARYRVDGAMSKPADFATLQSVTADEAVVTAEHAICMPGALLYAVDLAAERATFVVVGDTDADAERVLGAPFAYEAMFAAAKLVFTASCDELVRGAEARAALNAGRTRVRFVWSVARSGSTLMCRALGASRNVRCASEPDVLLPFCLGGGARRRQDRARFERIMHAAVLSLLPCGAAAPPAVLLLKPRSNAMRLAPTLHRLFPGATALFTHRDALPCAASMERTFGTLPLIAFLGALYWWHRHVRPVRLIVAFQCDELVFEHDDAEVHAAEREFADAFRPLFERDDLPFGAAFYATVVTQLYRYHALRARGVDVRAVRHETFVGGRRDDVCREALAHVMGDAGVDEDDVRAVVKASHVDSQKGSFLSRDAVQKRAQGAKRSSAVACDVAKSIIAEAHSIQPSSAPLLPIDDDLPGGLGVGK